MKKQCKDKSLSLFHNALYDIVSKMGEVSEYRANEGREQPVLPPSAPLLF